MKTAKILLLGLVLSSLAGLAADRPAAPQDAVTLAYKFTPGTPLSYKTTSAQVQNIDVMGQTMVTEISSSLDMTLAPKGLKDGNHLLGLTIDGMTVNVQGPQGGATPDLKDVIGKSFDMVLSPQGEEVDVSGAASLFIDMGQGGRREMTSDFQGIFPNFPAAAVKVGDKWPVQETITQKSDAGEIKIAFNNESTLDGFEKVDGFDCARIKTAVKGVMSGSLNQMGMSLGMDAKLEGTDTSYFAFKEGMFVKSESAVDLSGVITADSMGMTINFTGTQRSASALVKK